MPGYRYYAGFSADFVHDILSLWPKTASVLDPWNGSGTTTRVAADLGLRCVGVDLNPAMIVVAKSELLSDSDVAAIHAQAAAIGKLGVQRHEIDLSDPLLLWYDRSTVRKIRGLQKALLGRVTFDDRTVERLSGSEAFWLTALFQRLRAGVSSRRASNPTWLKLPGTDEARASIGWPELKRSVAEAARCARSRSDMSGVQVRLGSSSDLADDIRGVDLVLGSPPYFTRIDYAVATRVELAALGKTVDAQDALRRRLLGTTTVPRVSTILLPSVGRTAQTTLDAIAGHKSKASGTYYFKWFGQYLAGYSASLEQISRVTSPTGTVGLVVQDSYYKDVHLDLATITTEMMSARGWHLHRSYEFAPRRSMAQINPRATAYKGGAVPHEQALFFRAE